MWSKIGVGYNVVGQTTPPGGGASLLVEGGVRKKILIGILFRQSISSLVHSST